MLSDETFESCSIFKYHGEEERAEALEAYLRPKCTSPRVLEEHVLEVLWRWKLEEDDSPASPPSRRALPVRHSLKRAHARKASLSHSSYDVFRRSSKASRSSWEPAWMQTANESTDWHIQRFPINRLASAIDPQDLLMSVSEHFGQYTSIDSPYETTLHEPFPLLCPSNSPILGSLCSVALPLRFGCAEMASLFLPDGRIRRKRAIPAYSDYSLTRPRKKLTVQEAKLRAKGIEMQNGNIEEVEQTLLR